MIIVTVGAHFSLLECYKLYSYNMYVFMFMYV